MATTSIWSIKNNLKQSIDYIINPEKTINKDPGGIIIDITELLKNTDYEKIHRTALNIMKTHIEYEYYVMFIENEHIKEILKLSK